MGQAFVFAGDVARICSSPGPYPGCFQVSPMIEISAMGLEIGPKALDRALPATSALGLGVSDLRTNIQI